MDNQTINWEDIAKELYPNEYQRFKQFSGKGRRPDSVEFTDIEGDVSRRDLTVNALFYDIDKREIVDLVGGIDDIKNKQIRTVGKAADRFEEDKLRKLRALRFLGQFQGDLDKGTLNALKTNNSIEGVTPERIRDEFVKGLKKALSTKFYLQMCNSLGYLKQILPDLHISKDFIDSKNYLIAIAYLLRKNNLNDVKDKLTELTYQTSKNPKEVGIIMFLISLIKFEPKFIVEYKRLQNRFKVDNNTVLEFGKHINQDLTKFVEFNLTVKGTDAPSKLKGKQIGQWIKNKEIDNFMNM